MCLMKTPSYSSHTNAAQCLNQGRYLLYGIRQVMLPAGQHAYLFDCLQ